MLDRREFLTVSGLSLATLASGWTSPEPEDSTWLTYAPDVEQFWASVRFLERLRKLSEAGFTRYEFGRWKTKDIEAIVKLNDELGVQAAFFLGYPGLKGPKWKEGLLEHAPDAAELAPRLGSNRVGILAPDVDDKLDRDDQVADLVDALKEVVEKLDESESILILEPNRPVPNRPRSLLASNDEAAHVVKAVGSDRIKSAFLVERSEAVIGKLPGQINRLKAQIGAYRLIDFPAVDVPTESYARILRTIHDIGHAEPIGLGLVPKTDPSAVIESIRKLDAAAKAL